MSETSATAAPLQRDEMIRFAQLHQQFIDRTRLLATRAKSALDAANEAKLPYTWVLDFIKDQGATCDITRVCTLYLTLLGPDLEA